MVLAVSKLNKSTICNSHLLAEQTMALRLLGNYKNFVPQLRVPIFKRALSISERTWKPPKYRGRRVRIP